MSDRIAVFNDGHIEQVAAPAALYEAPASSFVAGFVGTSNLIEGQAALDILGREGVYSVRPEKLRVYPRGRPSGPSSTSSASKWSGDLRRTPTTISGARLLAIRPSPPLSKR